MRELPDPRHRALKATVRRLVRADPDDRWAAVFGRIAGYSFLVALVSGILLLPFFRPSMTPIVYHGGERSGKARPPGQRRLREESLHLRAQHPHE